MAGEAELRHGGQATEAHSEALPPPPRRQAGRAAGGARQQAAARRASHRPRHARAAWPWLAGGPPGHTARPRLRTLQPLPVRNRHLHRSQELCSRVARGCAV